MSRYLTSPVADFILQMFHIGELSQKSLGLASQLNFEKVGLKKIVELACFHTGLPDCFPPVYVNEYLDCLILLGDCSGPFSPVINQLLSNEALIVKSALIFLKVGQTMSVAESLVLLEEVQKEGSAILLKEKLFCKRLGWPIHVAEIFTQCAMEAEFFFQSLQSLKKQGIDIIPEGENSFLLNELCQSNDLSLDGKIIIELFFAKALNQEIWHFLSEMKMNSLQKHFLISTIVRLGERVNIDTLSLILSDKNSALALQIFTLLASEGISVAQYWEAIMQHKQPILLCYGTIELHKNGYLTHDNFLKITQAQQPHLAAKALSELLRSGIVLEECWNEFIEVEDPDAKAARFIDAIDPLKRHEDLPFELRQVISQHAQPQLAKHNAAVLLTISELSNLQRVHILTHEESDAIVQALRQLSELTVLNDRLIEVIIEDSDMIEPFKKYFALPSPSENLFSQLCQANSIREAEDLIKREQIMSKLMLDYPDVAALLLNIFSTSSVHQHQWATALTLLESIDEINANSVANLQQSSDPDKIAVAIVALKKSGLYTEHYFNRAVRREKRSPGIYNALRSLAETGELTSDLFNFVILSSSYDAIKAAKVLLKMPDVRRAHLDWLAMYSPNYEYRGNALVDIIYKLEKLGCLNRFWIEKLIQQKADRLEDIGCYLCGIPDHILNESILAKIIAHAGKCFYSRDEEEPEEYHSPFETFSEDRSLLTQEVIELILTRPSYQYWGENVYKSMSSLKKAGLFCPEIVKICTTTGMAEAIITLSQENQWNEMNREIIIASQNPEANAQLIVYLAKIHKYSAETANLLLRQLQLSSSIDNTKRRSSIHSTYFSKLFRELIDKNPTLQESTLQHLLSNDVNWLTIRTILENIEEKLIPDAHLCRIASANQHYLYTYVNYMEVSCRKKIKLSDIIKLCDYEFYLNKPELLSIISKASSKEKKNTSVDTERMQNLLINIWESCAREDQAEIHQSVLSYSEGVVKSVGQTSSLRL